LLIMGLVLVLGPATWSGGATAAGAIEVGILRFRVPADWQQIPAPDPRDNAFRIGLDAGPTIVFHRVPDGADPEEIIGLWPGLFTMNGEVLMPRRWTERVAGCEVTFFEAKGPLDPAVDSRSGGSTGARALLAALFNSRRGLVEVRVIGSPDEVERTRPAILKTLRTTVDAWKP